MMTSNRSTATVTPIVTNHSVCETDMPIVSAELSAKGRITGGTSGRQDAGGLFRRACGPQHREAAGSLRDDDVAIGEYSPPRTILADSGGSSRHGRAPEVRPPRSHP